MLKPHDVPDLEEAASLQVDALHFPILQAGSKYLSTKDHIDDWAFELSPGGHHLHISEWYLQCQHFGLKYLSDAVEVDASRRGGLPVLKGSNFTVAQTLAELAESHGGIGEVATDFGLDEEVIRRMLTGFSLMMQRSFVK
jgi:uncharacterized protein (DUF433 family)